MPLLQFEFVVAESKPYSKFAPRLRAAAPDARIGAATIKTEAGTHRAHTCKDRVGGDRQPVAEPSPDLQALVDGKVRYISLRPQQALLQVEGVPEYQ